MAFGLSRGAFVSPLGNAFFPEQTDSIFDSLKNTIFGKSAEYQKEPSRYSPEQQQYLQQALQQGVQGLGNGAIEGQARRGYQQQTIPMLSERFASIGNRGLSGIGSSGYQNALQDEGTNLELGLAANRQLQARDLINLGLQDTQQYNYVPESQGLLGPLLGAGIKAGSAYLTGGASEVPGIMEHFQGLFSGGSKAQTGIGTQGQSPLQQRLGQQSGSNLLNQTYGVNQSPYAPTNRSVFERGLPTNQVTAQNQFNQPGAIPGIRALNQANIAGMGGQNNLLSSLSRPYSGGY